MHWSLWSAHLTEVLLNFAFQSLAVVQWSLWSVHRSECVKLLIRMDTVKGVQLCRVWTVQNISIAGKKV